MYHEADCIIRNPDKMIMRQIKRHCILGHRQGMYHETNW